MGTDRTFVMFRVAIVVTVVYWAILSSAETFSTRYSGKSKWCLVDAGSWVIVDAAFRTNICFNSLSRPSSWSHTYRRNLY